MEVDLDFIDQLINDAKKRDFVRPERAFIYASFLVPPGTRLGNLDNYFHYFNSYPEELPCSRDVLHGHDSSVPCATPHMCHLFGFWPGPEHNPSFRRMFEKKWKELYEQGTS
jgi:hypothetical protein